MEAILQRRTYMLEHLAVMITIIAADQLVSCTINDWGDGRQAYFATEEELKLLLRAGASVHMLNKDNKDGTYGHHVQYRGLNFKNSSTTKMLTSQDK